MYIIYYFLNFYLLLNLLIVELVLLDFGIEFIIYFCYVIEYFVVIWGDSCMVIIVFIVFNIFGWLFIIFFFLILMFIVIECYSVVVFYFRYNEKVIVKWIMIFLLFMWIIIFLIVMLIIFMKVEGCYFFLVYGVVIFFGIFVICLCYFKVFLVVWWYCG